MALTAGATFAQIQAEYETTAEWFSAQSVALANRHAIAIRYLLLRLPTTSIKGSNTAHYDVKLLEAQRAEAEKFVKSKSSGNVVRADFRQLRSFG
jgi:hypothetical protein